MADIIERVRKLVALMEPLPGEARDTLIEVGDEIERLRAESEGRLSAYLVASKQHAECQQEIERLRAELAEVYSRMKKE
jgi:hypothetical protein